MNPENAVSGYLLDTHTAIWALDRPKSLSSPAREAANSGPNFLSIISYWEVMIKSMKGKLDVGDPRLWWHEALDQLVATALPLRPAHVSAMYDLPPVHQDPFDRILVAQAKEEGLTLVSMDSEIAQYASSSLRIIG